MKAKAIKVKVGSVTVRIYPNEYKKDGTRYQRFLIAYYAGGKRKLEARASEREARDRAQELALQIEQGRANVPALTNGAYESYVAAMNSLRPLDIPLHAAIQEYVAARSYLDGESLLTAVKEYARRHRHTVQKKVGTIVEELLATKERDGASDRYLKTLRCDLSRFAQAFQTNIGSVTSGLILEWLKSLAVGARSRNNIRGSVVAMFHFARALGYLPKGQATEADDVPKATQRGGAIGILKPEELAKLLAKADDEARLYLALGAFTGIRTAELIRLEWADINFERGHITVAADKAKTATRRLVPIQPNLMQWLAPYKGRSGRLFGGGFYVVPKRVIAFAREHVKWPQNALRHSYASYRLAITKNAAEVALEMGNSPQMLFNNYRELADEHDAKAWFAIAPKRSEKLVQFVA